MVKKKKMKFDVKSHNLVPKHAKLGQKEKKELFSRLNISLRELPKISINDPAVSGMDVEIGDVIKITRPSPTGGEAVFYRGVVGE